MTHPAPVAARRKPPTPTDEKIVVTVQGGSTFSTEVPLSREISLPRPPWVDTEENLEFIFQLDEG